MMPGSLARDIPAEQTIDLAAIAQVQRGDRVRVGSVFDPTEALFQKTLNLLPVDASQESVTAAERTEPKQERFVPDHADLRKLYLFAEALGGYETLHELTSAYSLGRRLSRRYRQRPGGKMLSEEEARKLEVYRAEIAGALENASAYLRANVIQDFTLEELHELNQFLRQAQLRAREITEILGAHLITGIETAVARLHEYAVKIQAVQRTVDGVFLVDSELMFIPTNELIACVNTIFRGVGNPYVADHIDGVLLLAARNLLIQVVSFYSFYGKHQIYSMLRKNRSALKTRAVTCQIRREISKLFDACKAGNKLVLTRVMTDAEREFELSVEAIQAAAEHSAVEAVKRIMPADVPLPAMKKKGWLRKIVGWLQRFHPA